MQQINQSVIASMAISPEERAFFVELGNRMAELRKARDITQVQMAEMLSVSQQTINSYETARRRIPASALPTIAKIFSITIDELLGEQKKQLKGKRGPSSKLHQQMEQVSQLPRSKQKLISEMIEAVLLQAER